MNVIGISGPIGHGKSTLAQALVANEPGSLVLDVSQIIAEVVEAWQQSLRRPPKAQDLAAINAWLATLPPILKQIVHDDIVYENLQITEAAIQASPDNFEKLFVYLDQLQARPELLGQKITPANKAQYRPILQWLGGYLVAAGDGGIWWRELVRRFKEAERDGVTLAVTTGLRYPSDATILQELHSVIVEICRPGAAETDVNDPTERQRKLIETDTTLYNDGTLAQLSTTAKRLLADIRAGTLRSEYHCKP